MYEDNFTNDNSLPRPPLVPPARLDPLLKPDSMQVVSLTLTVLSLFHAGYVGVVGQQGVGGVQVIFLHGGVVVLVCGEVLSHLQRSPLILTRPGTDTTAHQPLHQLQNHKAIKTRLQPANQRTEMIAASQTTNTREVQRLRDSRKDQGKEFSMIMNT